MGRFPDEVLALLDRFADVMSPGTRKAVVQSLLLMRNRGLAQPLPVLQQCFKVRRSRSGAAPGSSPFPTSPPFLFQLFRCRDKLIREIAHSHIVSDLKAANTAAKNDKVGLRAFSFVPLSFLPTASAAPPPPTS